jgi:AraC-like DNA-binding protein
VSFSNIIHFHSRFYEGLPFFWRGVGHEKIVSEKYVNPGQKRPAHLLIWQYTLSGCGHIEIGKNSSSLVPEGSSFLAQLPSDHNYYFKKKSDHWEFVWVVFAGPTISSICQSALKRPVYLFDRLVNPGLLKQLRTLISLHGDEEIDPWQNVMEASSLLIPLLRECSANGVRNLSKLGDKEGKDALLKPVIRNPALSIDKGGWAEQNRQSRFQLYRRIKGATGMSPKDVRNYQRTKEAIRYLRKPKLTLGDVTTLSGFKDQAYFCRFFKRETGFTPGQWRKQFG